MYKHISTKWHSSWISLIVHIIFLITHPFYTNKICFTTHVTHQNVYIYETRFIFIPYLVTPIVLLSTPYWHISCRLELFYDIYIYFIFKETRILINVFIGVQYFCFKTKLVPFHNGLFYAEYWYKCFKNKDGILLHYQ